MHINTLGHIVTFTVTQNRNTYTHKTKKTKQNKASVIEDGWFFNLVSFIIFILSSLKGGYTLDRILFATIPL